MRIRDDPPEVARLKALPLVGYGAPNLHRHALVVTAAHAAALLDGSTPGPWSDDENGEVFSTWRDPEDEDDDGTGWTVAESVMDRDRALVAAAPDLARSVVELHRQIPKRTPLGWDRRPPRDADDGNPFLPAWPPEHLRDLVQFDDLADDIVADVDLNGRSFKDTIRVLWVELGEALKREHSEFAGRLRAEGDCDLLRDYYLRACDRIDALKALTSRERWRAAWSSARYFAEDWPEDSMLERTACVVRGVPFVSSGVREFPRPLAVGGSATGWERDLSTTNHHGGPIVSISSRMRRKIAEFGFENAAEYVDLLREHRRARRQLEAEPDPSEPVDDPPTIKVGQSWGGGWFANTLDNSGEWLVVDEPGSDAVLVFEVDTIARDEGAPVAAWMRVVSRVDPEYAESVADVVRILVAAGVLDDGVVGVDAFGDEPSFRSGMTPGLTLDALDELAAVRPSGLTRRFRSVLKRVACGTSSEADATALWVALATADVTLDNDTDEG